MAGNDSRPETSGDVTPPGAPQLERLAGELHDGLLQYVIAARMMIDGLQRKLASADAEVPAEMDSIRQLLQQAVVEGRQLIERLHGGQADDVDLLAALRGLAEGVSREGVVACECQLPAELDLGQAANHLLLRLAQEAISNIRRHSQATSAQLIVAGYPGGVQLEVVDNGRGFDPAAVPDGHFGLSGMRRRAESLGGEFRIESNPGRGTRIVARIPSDRALG